MGKIFLIVTLLMAANQSIAQCATTEDPIHNLRCGYEVLPSVNESHEPLEIPVCEFELVRSNESQKIKIRDFLESVRPELISIEAGGSIQQSLIQGTLIPSFTPDSMKPNIENFFPSEMLRLEFQKIWETKSEFILEQVAKLSRSQSFLLETESSDLVIPGDYDFSSDRIPFRGYYWPMGGSPIANGSDSPLGKYDTFTASNSASDWERQSHKDAGNWSGHCNGWAAASVLYPEPIHSNRDPRTGTIFSIGDLKALLIENSFCVNYLFYGKRYNSAQDDPKDISPSLFHRVLVHYLRDQKKPVVFDIKPNEEVYNHAASRVQMVISGTNPVHVSATVTLHYYDGGPNNHTGNADSEQMNYEYELPVENGMISGDGSWISTNPDFIWVPIAPKDCANGRENPFVTNSWVDQIFGLPRE